MAATRSGGSTTASTPFLKEFSKKMSPNEGAIQARSPQPARAHTAASREEPQPKFSAATRMRAPANSARSRGKDRSASRRSWKRKCWYPAERGCRRKRAGTMRSVSTFTMSSGTATAVSVVNARVDAADAVTPASSRR
jgi:hypothetical protein